MFKDVNIPFILLIIACTAYGFYDISQKNPKESITNNVVQNVSVNNNNGNNIIFDNKDNFEYEFSIIEPTEIDFKTKQEVFSSRKNYVSAYEKFVKYYEPNETVFGQIDDGYPWWGLNGIMCKGPGQNSIDGLSEETRGINNPFLLVDIDFAEAHTDSYWNCNNLYPHPTNLIVSPSEKKITVTYNISRFKNSINGTSWSLNNYIFSFKGLNARDFGYEYGYLYDFFNISFKESQNISNSIHHFLDFIHHGGSCGYSGGCNNGSPRQPELEFKVDKLPAKATFKLFKNSPNSESDNPDLIYTIKME